MFIEFFQQMQVKDVQVFLLDLFMFWLSLASWTWCEMFVFDWSGWELVFERYLMIILHT